jgi:hypothetical protein
VCHPCALAGAPPVTVDGINLADVFVAVERPYSILVTVASRGITVAVDGTEVIDAIGDNTAAGGNFVFYVGDLSVIPPILKQTRLRQIGAAQAFAGDMRFVLDHWFITIFEASLLLSTSSSSSTQPKATCTAVGGPARLHPCR